MCIVAHHLEIYTMKLDAGNPNLMSKRERLPVYVSVPRDPDVVQAATLNIWKQPMYKSPSFETPRPGADNHLSIKSRGF
jgi:hypothetical protein